MTGAGGAVIVPRMLDVLSSGGVTNGEAPAQGPYLKIRWAAGVSRGRWDRRRGVEEALWHFPETGSGRRTIQRHIARRGGLFALSFIVGGGGPGGGSIWLRFWLEFRVVPRLRAAIASRDSSPAKSCPGRLGHSEFPLPSVGQGLDTPRVGLAAGIGFVVFGGNGTQAPGRLASLKKEVGPRDTPFGLGYPLPTRNKRTPIRILMVSGCLTGWPSRFSFGYLGAHSSAPPWKDHPITPTLYYGCWGPLPTGRFDPVTPVLAVRQSAYPKVLLGPAGGVRGADGRGLSCSGECQPTTRRTPPTGPLGRSVTSPLTSNNHRCTDDADNPRLAALMEKRVESREWSGSPYARLSPTSPLGVGRSAHLQRDYSTLAASVGSAGTTTIGRVELLHGLP
ncbi:hypothetical protein THAOC_03590 [Thalassiosira oceanica]|uniref:Uncharacterized protein n=1 Tax=Thalassiosira oceanica TaxID=159749 RepID=K0TC75_THAOC|nr:hypothetical protein THAOC_03590 [Thalassiosira oceanica]|eukprot:EJK74714.1 hypothetical protein THAOC_03590 [Thalassiosira oceanica]